MDERSLCSPHLKDVTADAEPTRVGSFRILRIELALAYRVAMRLRLTTALLALALGVFPALRAGLCAPGEEAAWHPHAHADGGVDHQHPSFYTAAHSHLEAASETGGPVGGSGSDAGIPCCRSASGSATISISLGPEARPKLLALAVVLPARELPTPRATCEPHPLFRDEQNSPYVRNRAPLLI